MKRAVLAAVILAAVVLVCGVMSGSASAGGGTYAFGAPGHWGGWWNGGWANFYAEHGHGPCNWCVNPYGNYADCDSCGCGNGCGPSGYEGGEMYQPVQPGEMSPPSEGPKPAGGTTMRQYESWPKATSLFPASSSR
jgi:hypothetical protein